MGLSQKEVQHPHLMACHNDPRKRYRFGAFSVQLQSITKPCVKRNSTWQSRQAALETPSSQWKAKRSTHRGWKPRAVLIPGSIKLLTPSGKLRWTRKPFGRHRGKQTWQPRPHCLIGKKCSVDMEMSNFDGNDIKDCFPANSWRNHSSK